MHSCGLCLSVMVLGVSLSFLSTLAAEVAQKPIADTPPDAGNLFIHERVDSPENEGRVKALRQQLAEDLQPDSFSIDAPGNSELQGSPVVDADLLRRTKRFWSSSNSVSSVEEPDNSGYAAAVDALLAYYASVQREGRRVVDMPDMTKRTTKHVFFIQVTTVLSVSGVKLRVPATLDRVSRVSAQALASGSIDMSTNVRLGDFETWGQYDVKVGGVGPSGDFETTIRDRVVRATVRFSELPAGTGGEVPGRCSLQATVLRLVERGRNDVPAILSGWAADVEDVPTTLRVMKRLLDERLAQFPCDDGFVASVRRGYASA